MIEFYFDCSSPWTYLAFHNIQPLAEELGVEIVWKPILVGGIFNTVNPSVYEARQAGRSPKASYHGKDLKDWTRKAGLKIKMPPSVFPVNSANAMRACIVLDQQGKLVDWATAVFEAYWAGDRDISQDEVLADIARSIQVDADALLTAMRTQPIKDQLRANTDACIARGGFGSPTMFVGDDMYFGNDRLVLVRDAVLRARG